MKKLTEQELEVLANAPEGAEFYTRTTTGVEYLSPENMNDNGAIILSSPLLALSDLRLRKKQEDKQID